MFDPIAVVGGGAWGTALAQAAAAAGRNVILWMRDARLAQSMNESRTNARYLPEVGLDARIRFSSCPPRRCARPFVR